MGGENGCVIPGTPIAVDLWRIRKCPQARVFFLTHMHADHIEGLTSTWNLPLYCSPVSKRLLCHKLKIRPDLVHELEVGETHLVSLDPVENETMSVTVIDANHCPGAVMYIFEGYFGKIVYTGDFRFNNAMVEEPPLRGICDVDVLYLDNSYCHPQCVFPTRSEALNTIIHIIEQHPDHNILIGMRNLGKEDMLEHLATYFDTWILVTPPHYITLQVLERPNVYTDDQDAGYIHAVPFQQIGKKLVREWNESIGPTLAILPTALFAGGPGEPYANQDDIFIVPYSDHSSYSELHQFVKHIWPKCIRPIVKGETGGKKKNGLYDLDLSKRADMSCFSVYLDPSPQLPVTVPESVQHFMFTNRVQQVCKKQGNKCRKRAPMEQILKKSRKIKKGVDFDSSSSLNGSKTGTPECTPEKSDSRKTGIPRCTPFKVDRNKTGTPRCTPLKLDNSKTGTSECTSDKLCGTNGNNSSVWSVTGSLAELEKRERQKQKVKSAKTRKDVDKILPSTSCISFNRNDESRNSRGGVEYQKETVESVTERINVNAESQRHTDCKNCSHGKSQLHHCTDCMYRQTVDKVNLKAKRRILPPTLLMLHKKKPRVQPSILGYVYKNNNSPSEPKAKRPRMANSLHFNSCGKNSQENGGNTGHSLKKIGDPMKSPIVLDSPEKSLNNGKADMYKSSEIVDVSSDFSSGSVMIIDESPTPHKDELSPRETQEVSCTSSSLAINRTKYISGVQPASLQSMPHDATWTDKHGSVLSASATDFSNSVLIVDESPTPHSDEHCPTKVMELGNVQAPHNNSPAHESTCLSGSISDIFQETLDKPPCKHNSVQSASATDTSNSIVKLCEQILANGKVEKHEASLNCTVEGGQSVTDGNIGVTNSDDESITFEIKNASHLEELENDVTTLMSFLSEEAEEENSLNVSVWKSEGNNRVSNVKADCPVASDKIVYRKASVCAGIASSGRSECDTISSHRPHSSSRNTQMTEECEVVQELVAETIGAVTKDASKITSAGIDKSAEMPADERTCGVRQGNACPDESTLGKDSESTCVKGNGNPGTCETLSKISPTRSAQRRNNNPVASKNSTYSPYRSCVVNSSCVSSDPYISSRTVNSTCLNSSVSELDLVADLLEEEAKIFQTV